MNFDEKHRPHLESLLEQGEKLDGVCAASRQQGLFKGSAVALGVTDRRLLVQPLDRRGEPGGETISITPERIADASAGGAGGSWGTIGSEIADQVAVKLKMKLTDGEKLQLTMMRGEGRLMGGLGGGEPQRRGLEALGEWFSSHERG